MDVEAWVLLTILVTTIACIITGLIVNAVNQKEVNYWWDKCDEQSVERHKLSFQLSLCEMELKKYKEADVQGQVDEMSKIIMMHNRGDFYESREIATVLHKKGYRLTEEKSNEDED